MARTFVFIDRWTRNFVFMYEVFAEVDLALESELSVALQFLRGKGGELQYIARRGSGKAVRGGDDYQ